MKNTMLESLYENTRMNFPLTKIIEATITEEIDNILKQQKPAMSSQDLEELHCCTKAKANQSFLGYVPSFHYCNNSIFSEFVRPSQRMEHLADERYIHPQ